MSYVDAIHDRDKDTITVVERSPKGERIITEYPANYVFYYSDAKGKARSIFGDPITKFSTRKRSEFEREKRIHSGRKLFESDINPIFRCLSENYLKAEAPKLHTCFFDIEVNFDPERGFSSPNDPFNSVTSISMYMDWIDKLITLVIPPPHMSEETATSIINEFPNCIMFKDELSMFSAFFELIEDADVLTGWNSEGYDIPYLVNRVTRVMSKDDTRKFCLLGEFPKPREYERFGKVETTFDLVGRIHLDYLQLYKKYNYESRHSYSLDSIAEYEEVGQKVSYEGTLDQLYNKDFKRFIEYNREDAMLIVKINKKVDFLSLANAIAHENTVLLPTVLGTVAMVEMAVMNEAHERGLVIPDKLKVEDPDETEIQKALKAAGAFVATPKAGIHEWVGAVDIKSLYPSAIRALNMAPETLVGQLRPVLTDHYMVEKAKKLQLGKKKQKDLTELSSKLWEGLFGTLEYTAVMNQERGTMITIDFEDGRSVEMSAAEVWKLIFDSHKQWILSANGTIFRYDQEGVIPGLLTRWYSDRKVMQKKLAEATTPEEKDYWDKRQLVRKIMLNSAYGALLNEHCRFYDKRIGQSVTLSGRQIVKHMMSQINDLIAGEYNHEGPGIVYGDTDSCYFSAWDTLKEDIENKTVEWSKEICIQLYDSIADQTNATFPAFLEKAFHVPIKNGKIISAGRELIGDRAIFMTKKRYAINIFDKEGKRLDKTTHGKIKAMGLDLKRADTPKYIQKFLMEVLIMVLTGRQKEEIVAFIKKFKHELSALDSWVKGSPKSVNNLTMYTELEKNSKTGKANMPGHVRAAMNYNYLRRVNNDNYSMKIVDGMKVIVCKLKPNALKFTSIAYPTDELHLPEWFTSLRFDDDEMERTLVDEKIDNLIGILNWDLRSDTGTKNMFHDLFKIG